MQIHLLNNPLIPRGADCAHCSLCEDGIPDAPVYGDGADRPELVIVGEAPGATEARTGEPFKGPSGKLLDKALADHGIDREEVYVTNTLLCLPPHGKALRTRDLRACSGRLYRELDELPSAKVILCLGATAITALRGEKSTLAQWNGRTEWSEKYGAHLVFAYHPAAVLRRPELYDEFLAGIRTAIDMLDAPEGPIEVEDIEWEVETSLWHMERVLHAADPDALCVVDIETEGLDPFRHKLLSVGLCWNTHEAYIIPALLLHDWAGHAILRTFLMSATKIIGHNLKFDVQHLDRQIGARPAIYGDTMLLHHALDERSGGEGGGFHDLKTLAYKYCGAPHYAADVDGAHLADLDPEKLYEYQANDLVYTRRLWDKLTELAELEPPSREGYPMPRRLHDVLTVPAANALVDIELRGVRVDKRLLDRLLTDYSEKIEASRVRCEQYAGHHLVGVKFKKGEGFNPRSPVQVAQVLRSMGYPNVSSTAELALHDYQRWEDAQGRPREPFLDEILEYRSLAHTRATYLVGIEERLKRGPADNDRLRTSLLLHGTTSGRLASRDPNMQNIPADSIIKSLFIPADDHVMCNADYRRLEVGVLAWYSGDERLTADFLADDFHWNVAERIFPTVTKAMVEATTVLELERLARRVTSFHDFADRQMRPEERTDDFATLFGWLKTRIRRQSKYVSFGIMYGEGAAALSSPEKGLGVSIEEAQTFITTWKETYRDARNYLYRQAALAKRTRWVESASGRRRRFPYPNELETHIVNEAMNHSIQALASDICLMALIKLNRMLPELGWGNVLLSVHDSILFELHKAHVKEATDLIHSVMTTILVSDALTFEVDIATGSTWADCH